jgi:putative spermidine/putrescine transport system substrate-binding protein
VRRSPIALLAAAVLVTAAACGDSGQKSTATAPAVDAGATGEGALHLVTADGITLGQVIPAFETATGCKVTVDERGSSAEVARGAAADTADVFALSGDAVLSLAAADIAAPLPRGADDDVLPAVRQAGDQSGRRYGIPFVWGPELLLSSRRTFPVPPASFDSLYDPAYAGRIAVPDDPLQIALAALVLGTGDPYALAAADLDAAGQLVQRQRPLVREYWSDPADLAGLFADGKIVLGQARGKVASSLAALGVDATVPAGPALGWSDWFVTATHAPHPRCAAKWRNYALSPSVQIALAHEAGGSPAVRSACAVEGPTACAADRLDDNALLGALHMARTPLEPTGIGAWEQTWGAARR